MKQVVPTALVILDGFGYSEITENNAVYHAKTPFIKYATEHYWHTLLRASGTAVGLPDGYIGNSEVGHLTIGSGRIIPQPIRIIHDAIADRSFFTNHILVNNLQKIRQSGGSLHIMGLLSDAGVHSDIEHIYAYLDAAHQNNIQSVYIHAFLDGRDTPPQSASSYLEQLDDALSSFEYGSIASIHGRFYAMDRDNHWDRTEKSYQVLAYGQPCITRPWQEILEEQYAQGITDEFIMPIQLDPTSSIRDGDGIIFTNVREDRARQLTACFVDPHFNHFKIKKIALSCFITPVLYAPYLKTAVLFKQEPILNTLKDVLSAHHKTIFSIAETEKYAHISYFFTGKREEPVPGETRVLIPSLSVKNYAHNPCMSAPEITAAVCSSLKNNPHDFYLINYANADMVGHSGDFAATVKAIECLDTQLKHLYEIIVEQMGGTLYITADHGKAEQMYDAASHQEKTAHTHNPVLFIAINKKKEDRSGHLTLTELAHIAPFILHNMDIPIPELFTPTSETL